MGLRQPWARPVQPGQHGRVPGAQAEGRASGVLPESPAGARAGARNSAGRGLGRAGCVRPVCRAEASPPGPPRRTPEMAWTATRRKPFTSPFSLTMATRCTRGTGYSRLLRYTKALRGEAALAPAQRVGGGAGDGSAELTTQHCKAELGAGRRGSRRGGGRVHGEVLGGRGRGRGGGWRGAERGPRLLPATERLRRGFSLLQGGGPGDRPRRAGADAGCLPPPARPRQPRRPVGRDGGIRLRTPSSSTSPDTGTPPAQCPRRAS